MPDREERIAQWRRSLAETMGCTNEILDELESHLRDDLEQLVQSGHAEEQAFALAVSRLGPPRALAGEFAKAAERASWLPVRVATFAAVALGSLFIGYLLARCQDGRFGLLLAAHIGAITLGYSASLLAGMLAICFVAIRPFRALTGGQIQNLQRAILTLTAVAGLLTFLGILLGCVWAKDHLGRYWDWDPRETWAVGVLVWNTAVPLLMAGRVWEQRVLLLSILGNSVVAFAWSAGAPHLRNALTAFAMTHLLLFGLGFLPAERLRIRRA